VLAMEAGWVVTEVGRQPWIVHNYMTVTQAATTNKGVWLTFVIVFAIYAVVGVTTILVLRGMSRRYREAGELDETQVPYGPSDPGILGHEPEEVPVG
jgi:cytochrome bd ubiquinol oxidase subunit I